MDILHTEYVRWEILNGRAASMAEPLSRLPRVQEVWSSNPEPAKSCKALQTVRHRFNIYTSSCVALVL